MAMRLSESSRWVGDLLDVAVELAVMPGCAAHAALAGARVPSPDPISSSRSAPSRFEKVPDTPTWAHQGREWSERPSTYLPR